MFLYPFKLAKARNPLITWRMKSSEYLFFPGLFSYYLHFELITIHLFLIFYYLQFPHNCTHYIVIHDELCIYIKHICNQTWQYISIIYHVFLKSSYAFIQCIASKYQMHKYKLYSFIFQSIIGFILHN